VTPVTAFKKSISVEEKDMTAKEKAREALKKNYYYDDGEKTFEIGAPPTLMDGYV
jgi:hypothetical protein